MENICKVQCCASLRHNSFPPACQGFGNHEYISITVSDIHGIYFFRMARFAGDAGISDNKGVKYNFSDSKLRLDNIVSKWYFIFTHDMSRHDIPSVNMTRKEMPHKAMPHKAMPYKAMPHKAMPHKATPHIGKPQKLRRMAICRSKTYRVRIRRAKTERRELIERSPAQKI